MVKVKISIGELLDKMTILEIKREKITDETKLEHIDHELAELAEVVDELNLLINVPDEVYALLQVNEQLWTIEDRIREKERLKEFDNEFIELARSVYITNDKRADIKKQINIKSNSELVEEKSYADYS